MTTDREADEGAAADTVEEPAESEATGTAGGTQERAAGARAAEDVDVEGGADVNGPDSGAAAESAEAGGSGRGADGDGAVEAGGPGRYADGGAQVSEAQAELAAQRELRARIEQRKAEESGPVAAGGKLSGQAADLLAAVRAVESGGTPDPAVLRATAPAPERTAPAPATAVPALASASAPSACATSSALPAEAVDATRAVLSEGGAPGALAGPVTATLGERAAEALRADPWQLLAVPGVRPEQADGFARALLGADCGPGDGRRAVALVGWLLERAAVQGHTALEADAVRTALAKQGVPDPDEAVRHAVAEGAVLVFHDEEPEEVFHDEEPEEDANGSEAGQEGAATPGEGSGAGPARAAVPVLLGLDRFALAEESLADGLARLVKTAPESSWPDVAGAEGAMPSPSAAELLRAVAGHGLVLHTGGEAARAEPVAVAAAARGLGLRAAVAVHSENGRDRLRADGAEGVLTVAALLAGAEGPGRDADGMFVLDLLVVLDAPQLDVETAAMLVESVADGCRLVLGGDPGVLGSAGAGRVFGDLLAARVRPQVASRTPDPGPIGELVSGIGVGELSQVPAPDKEIVIVPVKDAGEAVHRTVQLVAESVPRAFGLSAEQAQVITVGHGGFAGTRALNAALKQRLAPGPGRFGGFDPGDRVAYVPAPGRTLQGTVVSAGAEGLRVRLDGPAEQVVTVPKGRVETELRHGWALTAHQAAGMRWPAAVVVLPGDAAAGLSRAWVYTAFGRGAIHLSVVHGVDQALPRAVSTDDSRTAARGTRLKELIETLLAAPEEQ